MFFKLINDNPHKISREFEKLFSEPLTVIHVVDGAECVNPAAHDAVLPVQHPSPASSAVPVAAFVAGGQLRDGAVHVGGGRHSLRRGLQLHAELDEAAH